MIAGLPRKKDERYIKSAAIESMASKEEVVSKYRVECKDHLISSQETREKRRGKGKVGTIKEGGAASIQPYLPWTSLTL